MKKILLGGGGGPRRSSLAGLVSYGLYRKHQGRDVRGSSSVEFVTTQAPKPKPKPGEPVRLADVPLRRRARRLRPRGSRRRSARPSGRTGSSARRSLVEFPPAIAYGRLYVANANGTIFALDTALPGRDLASPDRRAARRPRPRSSAHTVFMSFLNKPPCNATRSGLDGEVVALDADTGKVRWRVTMGPTESSPLVVGGLVYVGDWRGEGLRAEHAHRAHGVGVPDRRQGQGRARLRGRPRLLRLLRPPRLRAERAHRAARLEGVGAQERLGPRGTFYSTPAVAYGRVYIGATDRKVYSFGATSGKLRWSHGTGGYVYALARGVATSAFSSAPTTARSTASTPPPGTSAGASRRTGRSPARRS